MRLDEIRKNKYGNEILLKSYMYQTKEEIEDWCRRVFPNKKLFVNKELEIEPAEKSIDFGMFGGGKQSEAVINLSGKKVLPVQFKLGIDFDLGDLELNSFVGCPFTVMADFEADNMFVSSLEGMPKLVGGSRLKMKINNSTLEDFEGFSQVTKQCNVSIYGTKLLIKSIKGISDEVASMQISGKFMNVKELVQYCPNLKYIHLMSVPDFSKSPGYLNLFRLKKLEDCFIGPDVDDKNLPFKEATEIFNKHLAGDRDMLDCQEELIEKGLKEYART